MAVLGGASFLAASLARDLGFKEVSLRTWTERGTGYGAAAGFTALVMRALGVH
jgi:hypothetical protein